jgi:hypothetical protein
MSEKERNVMRNINLEAAIWYLFTSPEFFETAALDTDSTLRWFENLAASRDVSNFGRTNQIYDTFKSLRNNLRRGSALARLGDYQLIFDTARSFTGSARGMLEQPLHSWMTEREHHEFEWVRISRATAYTNLIKISLHNAIWGAEIYFSQYLTCQHRRNDDNGFPGSKIVDWYNDEANYYENPFFPPLPDPAIEYVVDKSISCHTGDEVPWTGVWYPGTGLQNHSLSFAIKGMRMQPVYKVIKTTEELRTETCMFPPPETVAIATTWNPVILAPPKTHVPTELWSKAGQQCPREGVWEPTDPGATRRYYRVGDVMLSLGSAHGYTVWRWVSER